MDCPFCEENLISKLEKKEIINRIVYSSKNFNVFPTLGSFIEGYLLITSKSHYISIANIPDILYNELEEVQEKVRKVLSTAYTPPIFFEHGPISRYDRAGCCVEHAHLHCFPANIDILEDLSKHFKYEVINSFLGLPKETSYLFYENQDRKKFIFPIDTIIPSQYLRQIVAVKSNNSKKWDWRQHPCLEEMKKTIDKLEGLF